jgi:SIR2-like domain
LGDLGSDIEWVLSTLTAFASETDFTEFIHLERSNTDSNARVEIAKLKHAASEEVTRLKKTLFNRLRRYDATLTLTLYLSILKELQKAFAVKAFSVFTTNYDLTFETAMEQPGALAELNKLGPRSIEYGFAMHFGRPIYDARDQFAYDWSDKRIEFYKLHGSLDWHIDPAGQCTRAGSIIVPDEPSEVPILYPGYKAIPDSEPFSSLHGRLHKRLTDCARVSVFGFAFRDAYINSIFDNVLRSRPELPVDCYNPIARENCPRDSKLPYFVNTYPNFKHIEVGLTKEPFVLHGGTAA